MFCFGPALNHLESDIPDYYYVACGNARIATWRYIGYGPKQCSFSHQLRYIFWNYACTIASGAFELERVPEARGNFGLNTDVAAVLSINAFVIFILVMSAFNYVIMGRVLRKANEGVAIIYHRWEIGCDTALAMICVVPYLELSNTADWITYVLTGKQEYIREQNYVTF
jgi:hypothetical protein